MTATNETVNLENAIEDKSLLDIQKFVESATDADWKEAGASVEESIVILAGLGETNENYTALEQAIIVKSANATREKEPANSLEHFVAKGDLKNAEKFLNHAGKEDLEDISQGSFERLLTLLCETKKTDINRAELAQLILIKGSVGGDVLGDALSNLMQEGDLQTIKAILGIASKDQIYATRPEVFNRLLMDLADKNLSAPESSELAKLIVAKGLLDSGSLEFSLESFMKNGNYSAVENILNSASFGELKSVSSEQYNRLLDYLPQYNDMSYADSYLAELIASKGTINGEIFGYRLEKITPGSGESKHAYLDIAGDPKEPPAYIEIAANDTDGVGMVGGDELMGDAIENDGDLESGASEETTEHESEESFATENEHDALLPEISEDESAVSLEIPDVWIDAEGESNAENEEYGDNSTDFVIDFGESLDLNLLLAEAGMGSPTIEEITKATTLGSGFGNMAFVEIPEQPLIEIL